MTVPSIGFTFQNSSLGMPGSQASGNVVLIGACSLGTANVPVGFGAASATEVRSKIGYGPLAQYVAGVMGVPQHRSVVAIPATPTAGSFGTVTTTGTTPPVLTMSGTVNDEYPFVFLCVKAGTETAAQVIWSADGVNFSQPVSVASAITLGSTGAIATFATGTYTLAHTWRVTSVAPSVSDTNLGLALDALKASGQDFSWIHAITAASGASDAARATAFASTFAAVSAKLAGLVTVTRFAGCTLELPAPFATDASGLTSWVAAMSGAGVAGLQDDRMAGCAGYCVVQSPLQTQQMRRSIGYNVARRISAAPLSETLHREDSGPFSDVISLEHDASLDGTLHDARLITMRKLNGAFFITGSPMMSAPASDISTVPMRRVQDETARLAYFATLKYLGEDFDLDRTTGNISEADAVRIDNAVTKSLQSGLSGEVSAVQARVSRVDDLIRVKIMHFEIAIVPKGYVDSVLITVGYARTI